MKIKTIDIIAKEWFDKVNGNSYFSAIVEINFNMKDSKVIEIPFQYGYGDSYRYSALEAMDKAKWLPVKYRGHSDFGSLNAWDYERENNYPIHWTVTDGLKRDCVSNGTV